MARRGGRKAKKAGKNKRYRAKKSTKRPVQLRMMMVSPSERYFEWGAAMVRMLTDSGRPGVYVSFHRPFGNVIRALRYYGVDTGKLAFVDVATGMAKEKGQKNPKCIHVPKADVDGIDKAVRDSLKKLNGKKFIFVDSLTIHTFYRPPGQTRRLAKTLIEKIDREHANYIVFNVAEELADLEFIKALSKDVDEIIKMPSK